MFGRPLLKVKHWRCSAATVFVWLLLLGSSPVRANEATGGSQREWTVMIYMNGKNNLEPDALNNFHAMASVGSSDKVALVVQLGRPKHPSKADGNWSGVYRFLVGKDQAPRPGTAVEKVAAGVASDMGRPQTLADFIKWSKVKYPAKHYMLIVWNHGQGYRLMLAMLAAKRTSRTLAAPLTPKPGFGPIGGFRAVSSDEDTGSILYNAEVQQAISLSFSGTDKLDVIGFDACLMSMLETGYALKSSAKIMVASEELEPGDGWQYAEWVGKLVASPGLDGTALGRAIVESYGGHYGDSYFTTLSMVELSRMDDVALELSQMSDAIRNGGTTELMAMRAARAELSSYGDWDDPPSYLSVDLATLLQRYRSKTSTTALQQQAERVANSARSSVMANYSSKRSQGTPNDGLYGSQGLAIYYPRSLEDFQDDYFHTGYLKSNKDRPIEFVRKERWADLLYALLGIK